MLNRSLVLAAAVLASMGCGGAPRPSPRESKLVGKWEFDETLNPNYKPSGFEAPPSVQSNEHGPRMEFEPNGYCSLTGGILGHGSRLTGTWQVLSEDEKRVTINLDAEHFAKSSKPLIYEFVRPGVVRTDLGAGDCFYKRVK